MNGDTSTSCNLSNCDCDKPKAPHALTGEQVITEREMTEMAQAFGHDLRWVGFCLKVKAQRQALAAMTAERNAAETERIEWVLRAERAESLVEEIKEVRDEYHQQWMDALESEERGKAQLTASEQEAGRLKIALNGILHMDDYEMRKAHIERALKGA